MIERQFLAVCDAARRLHRAIVEAGFENDFDIGVTPRLYMDLKGTLNSPRYMMQDNYENSIVGIPIRVIKSNACD